MINDVKKGNHMKYIITSGPMEMKIDNVRKIKNSSTGKLGATIADYMNSNYKQVVYIHTKGALVPNCDCKKLEIETHAQLLEYLENEMEDGDVVIHAMAISDFKTKGTISSSKLSDIIYKNKSSINSKEDIEKIINDNLILSSKLSSENDQVVLLEKEVKVIDEIKKINDKVVLIGFKLLTNTNTDELLKVAGNLKKRANCDILIANKMEEVRSETHHAYVITDSNILEANSKMEIAENILNIVEEK